MEFVRQESLVQAVPRTVSAELFLVQYVETANVKMEKIVTHVLQTAPVNWEARLPRDTAVAEVL